MPRRKGEDAELELLMLGKTAEAKKVRLATNRLSRRIDDGIAALMRAWLGQAAAVQGDIRKRNARLQGCIRDIRKKIKVAENVVKATKILDEAAKLAAKAFGI